ncbi:PD-(D/E)XK nuclease family protein [Anabaena sp. WA102]|uniref:PD-(D/E)XK nuclease family protein n=1 Tax=Anabaena sp. WA102 TaxID=1647413 RepID=UPI0009D684C4|nr:PD-(D/E)XK nuclease family protein [Anabaena sp. WA102]
MDSGEHSNQLERYQNIIDIEYKNYRKILIYLTPEGSLSSENNWRIYSYSQVVEIIDSICKSYKSTIGADIYTLMTHYSTLIRRHIVSDSEIAELCRKIYFKHRQALDLIIEHRPDLQSEIAVEIKKLLNPLIESNEIFADFWNKGWISFGAKDWENKSGSREMICFVIENLPGSLIMIVQLRSIEDKEIRQKIFDLLQEQDHSKILKKTKLNRKYMTIYNRQILNKIDYEDGDIENIFKKIQDFWEDFIKNDFVSIEKIISENIEVILKDN